MGSIPIVDGQTAGLLPAGDGDGPVVRGQKGHPFSHAHFLVEGVEQAGQCVVQPTIGVFRLHRMGAELVPHIVGAAEGQGEDIGGVIEAESVGVDGREAEVDEQVISNRGALHDVLPAIGFGEGGEVVGEGGAVGAFPFAFIGGVVNRTSRVGFRCVPE